MNISEEIAKKVNSRRNILGISQKDLAELSGVSERTIRDIEQGKGNPGLNQIKKILDILGLSITIGILRNE
ncbi:MAG: helix-turn-helix domain-containing protein [Rhodothermaceae bacterium]